MSGDDRELFPQPGAELLSLVAAACDGTIAADDFRRLEAMLRADPAAKRFYVAYLDLHGRLLWRYREDAAAPASSRAETAPLLQVDRARNIRSSRPLGPSRPRGVLRKALRLGSEAPLANALTWLVMAVLCSGMVLTIAFCVALLLRGGGAKAPMDRTIADSAAQHPLASGEESEGQVARAAPPAPASSGPAVPASSGPAVPASSGPAVPASSGTVARLIRALNCRWAAGSHAPRTGDDLAPGRKLVLRSGLAEIMFQSGVRAVLQGPATMEIGSRTAAILRDGKLAVTVVDPDGRGFAVYAPGMKYTDLGTEFGVWVARNGAQEVHVFRGTVQAEAVAAQAGAADSADDGQKAETSPARPAPPLVLKANQAARIARAAAPLEPIAADERQFVRAAQMPRLAADDSPDFQAWKQARQHWRERPDLLAYYDFQPDESDRSVLRNCSSAGRLYDGKISADCRWVEGRMTGKYALRFAALHSGVTVDIPVKLSELTLAAWIKVDRLERWYQGLFMSDDWDQRSGVIHWQLNQKGRVVLASHWGSPPDNLLSAHSLTSSELSGWHFVATTFSASESRAVFYFDGARVNDCRAGVTPLLPGRATLGDYYGAPQENDQRPLEGCMDEFMLFSKALSGEEIRAAYRAGKPPAAEGG